MELPCRPSRRQPAPRGAAIAPPDLRVDAKGRSTASSRGSASKSRAAASSAERSRSSIRRWSVSWDAASHIGFSAWWGADMGRVDPGDRARDQGAPRQGPRSGGEAMALDAAVRPDPAPHPGASVLDRLTRSCVLRLSRLEQVKDVLRARGRPKSEELVIRIGEGPTAADRHSARVSDLRENHGWKLVSPACAQDPWRGARPPVSLRLAEASVIPTKDETFGARPSRERG